MERICTYHWIPKSVGLFSISTYSRTKKRKSGPKTFDTLFIGYAKSSASYGFLIIKSENGLVEVNFVIET